MSKTASADAWPLVPSIRRTRTAIWLLWQRLDSRAVLFGTGVAYLLVYLFAIGDLSLVGDSGVSVVVADRPIESALRTSGYFSYDAVALVEGYGVTYLFSPINTAIALGLATLVGLNLSLSYLGWRQPAACGFESSTGFLASVPALLSGAACCGPVVLIVLGIQATGLLITGFQLLLPLAVVLLLASLLLIGRRVDPAAF